MPRVSEIVRVAENADALWREIGAFAAIGSWHPMVDTIESEGDRPGARRTAHLRGGRRSVERLMEFAPGRRTYRYDMVSTLLPEKNYVGEFRVEDNGDGTSTVVWSGTFEDTSGDEARTVEAVRDFLRAGLDNLAALYGNAAAPRLVGINHVALEVGDLEAALAEGRGQTPDEQRHFGLVVDDRAGLRERAEAAGATILDGPGLEILDPWGNRLEVVEYRRVQFTKPDAVLDALNVAPDKTDEAKTELRDKGIEPEREINR